MTMSHTDVFRLKTETGGVQLPAGGRAATITVNSAAMKLAYRYTISGTGVISEYVMRKGVPDDTPAYAKVILIREADNLVIDKTFSDPVTGAYSFPDLSKAYTYTALAYDPTGAQRAQAANNLVPT